MILSTLSVSPTREEKAMKNENSFNCNSLRVYSNVYRKCNNGHYSQTKRRIWQHGVHVIKENMECLLTGYIWTHINDCRGTKYFMYWLCEVTIPDESRRVTIESVNLIGTAAGKRTPYNWKTRIRWQIMYHLAIIPHGLYRLIADDTG